MLFKVFYTRDITDFDHGIYFDENQNQSQNQNNLSKINSCNLPEDPAKKPKSIFQSL